VRSGGRGDRPTQATLPPARCPAALHRLLNTATAGRLAHLQKADADLFVTFCTGGALVLSSAARDLVFEHCLREGGQRQLAGESARPTPRIHLHAVVPEKRDGSPD